MVNTVQEAEARVTAGKKNGDVPHIKFPSEVDRPCYRVYRHAFIADDRLLDPGIYYHGVEEDRSGSREPFDRRILSNVNVLAIVRTDAGTEHSYLLEYVPHGEKVIRRCVMPQSILLGRAEEVTKFLRPLGITAHYQDKDLIRTYLDYQHVDLIPLPHPRFGTVRKLLDGTRATHLFSQLRSSVNRKAFGTAGDARHTANRGNWKTGKRRWLNRVRVTII